MISGCVRTCIRPLQVPMASKWPLPFQDRDAMGLVVSISLVT